MRMEAIWLAGLAAFLGAALAAASPVSKTQLLEMSRDKVDPSVVRAIVERDCVDFDVDAGNAAELSRAVAPEVLQAAIRCRADAPAAASASEPHEAAPPAPREPHASAPPAPPTAASSLPAGGFLRVSAEFIGESGALSCSCVLDGQPVAVLTKPEQGEFGQAVPRTKIRKQSADLPVSAGKHRVVFRCDPKNQEVSADLEIATGQRRTVAIRETTLRGWKLVKID